MSMTGAPDTEGAAGTRPAARARTWSSTSLGIGAVVLMLAVLAPFQFYPVFLAQALCFALFASAFNLLIGYVGLLSFGHAAFFGGAAYVSAFTLRYWGLTPELAILLGTAAAGALGLVFGFLAIRRSGIYFAMITLALAQMVFFLAVQTPSFTGGEDGIPAVPRSALFGIFSLDDNLAAYYFVLAVFILAMLLIYRTIHSPFGQVLKAIRENEPRAISLGYKVDRYKLLAFVLSAALAGLAGGTKALVVQVAALSDVQWQMSGEVVLMTLLGGIGTIFGPAVGALVVVALQFFLSGTALPVPVVIGAIFVVCVLVFRRGIVGELLHLVESRRSR